MSEIFKTQGIVTAISIKDNGKFGVCLDKKDWYNGFGGFIYNKGDEVEIEFTRNNEGFNNIHLVKLINQKANYPAFKKIEASKEMSQDRITGMLVSYVKDIVIEDLLFATQNGEKDYDLKTRGKFIAECVAEWNGIINEKLK